MSSVKLGRKGHNCAWGRHVFPRSLSCGVRTFLPVTQPWFKGWLIWGSEAFLDFLCKNEKLWVGSTEQIRKRPECKELESNYQEWVCLPKTSSREWSWLILVVVFFQFSDWVSFHLPWCESCSFYESSSIQAWMVIILLHAAWLLVDVVQIKSCSLWHCKFPVCHNSLFGCKSLKAFSSSFLGVRKDSATGLHCTLLTRKMCLKDLSGVCLI